jgi:hypothetical protein
MTRFIYSSLCALFVFSVFSGTAIGATQQPIRVNCGGSSYTDKTGQLWQADFGFNIGSVGITGATVAGTPDPKLYGDQRWNASQSTPLVYSFPVANGLYQVNLLFAESVPAEQHAGARVFNVKVDGTSVFQKVDVFAEAGANKALIKSVNVQVQNGRLNIELDHVVQNPMIDALEILPLPASGPALSLSFKYSDGTAVAGNLNYTITSSLLNFEGKEPLTNGQAQAVLFTSPNQLGISTQFQVKLSLVDTAGHTLWAMSLGLNPSDVNLTSVLNSVLNVTVKKL